MHVLRSLHLSLAHLLPPVLELLRKGREDVFGGFDYSVDLVLDEF